MSPPKPHAIMISFPFQGHITPFVSLAMKLASRGFVVTFVHVEFVHHMLSLSRECSRNQADPFSEARESGLDLRYKTIDDGFPLEFDRVLNREEYWETMFRDFPDRVDEIVVKAIQESGSALAPFLLADTLYTWPATIARKHNLVNVSFWTEPALVFSLAYHMDLLKENGHFPCKDHVEEEIKYLPGIDSISTKDFMPYLKKSSIATIAHKIALRTFGEVKKADFILHNTVQELESEILSALNKMQPNYAVGPINFSRNLSANTVHKSLWSESDCTHWLDSKSLGSVLYISFGSFVRTSDRMIEEIAYGLLLSEVHFVWVVRDDAGALPAGFRDEVKGKGLIIPWCNQMKVLSNPGVGGFLTHCGWNSVLESVWCGVPMICYPMLHDQPINRKLVVDDWKIGINLCDVTSVDRKEVSEKIKRLIGGTSSERLRREANQMKEKLQNALDPDYGSSEKNFDQFIKDLKARLIPED